MDQLAKIFVAGHRGMVGSAIVRKLQSEGYKNLILSTHHELDLTNQASVDQFFAQNAIDYVFLAAARVGGIHANSTYQADFLYENVMIAANVLHAAAQNSVQKLLYLGSTCIYPRLAHQPMKEECLLTGALEPTNEAYALAKIVGVKFCEKYQMQYKKRFISAMPTNLYGPFDNFHPENSHVIPGMMRRIHEAKIANATSVTIWGTGTPLREFLYVEDLADALFMLMKTYEARETVNVGTGVECSIRELAETLKEVIGFKGQLDFDTSKPDGSPRKVSDVSKIKNLGWRAQMTLKDGLKKAYAWAIENKAFEKNYG